VHYSHAALDKLVWTKLHETAPEGGLLPMGGVQKQTQTAHISSYYTKITQTNKTIIYSNDDTNNILGNEKPPIKQVRLK
jgi:hypothetical protein